MASITTIADPNSAAKASLTMQNVLLYGEAGQPVLVTPAGRTQLAGVTSGAGDSLAAPTLLTDASDTPRSLGVMSYLWDDSNSSGNRQRGNTQGTLLASAARTATTSSPQQTNYNARGVIVYLNVTAASGTGGLTLQFYDVDPVSGQQYQINAAAAAITAVIGRAYVVYPAASGVASAVGQVTALPLPRTWVATVAHGDASNYTYSLGFSLIV